MGDMESIHPELALYGRKNECARTDTVFFPISEVSEGKVSLTILRMFIYVVVKIRMTLLAGLPMWGWCLRWWPVHQCWDDVYSGGVFNYVEMMLTVLACLSMLRWGFQWYRVYQCWYNVYSGGVFPNVEIKLAVLLCLLKLRWWWQCQCVYLCCKP